METEYGVVQVVRYPEIIARIDRNAGWIVQAAQVEVTWRRRTLGHFPNGILKGVADVEVTALVDREANRKVESTDLFARRRGAFRIDKDVTRPGGCPTGHVNRTVVLDGDAVRIDTVRSAQRHARTRLTEGVLGDGAVHVVGDVEHAMAIHRDVDRHLDAGSNRTRLLRILLVRREETDSVSVDVRNEQRRLAFGFMEVSDAASRIG